MIVFVNGASSSGKTSLARELQALWEGPLVYWSLDNVISQLPFHYTGEGQNAEDGFPLVSVEGGFQVGIGSVGLRLNGLSAQYVRAVSESGIDIVADFVLLNERMLAPYIVELANQPLVFVGIDCDSSELERRNGRRSDRASGLSALQQQTVHFCRARYDLELSSSDSDTKEMVRTLLSHPSLNSPKFGFR